MLEGLVANLLNRFLGMYVKNFNAQQLNVGIWNGDVKLRNLELRREALDQLHLPVNVVEGYLGSLTMSIPWTSLRGKPVRVTIEDVFLLAAPKEDAEYDEEEEANREHSVKMEKLENAELLKQRNSEGLSQEEQQKSQSFAESLTTAIVDNLQVSIKNIHIRYEDSIAAPGHPFALGLTLKEFSAVSTDENWRPSFIQATSGTTHKLAVLGELALYWNTDATLFGTGKGTDVGAEAQKSDRGLLADRFRQAIQSGENYQHMLKPVSGRAALELDKTGKVEKPKVKARLLFNELGFVLDEDQYRDALMMVDLFHYFIRHQEYKKYQPKSPPKEDPKAWLRFAFTAVHRKIQDRNRKWTWGYIRERRDDRLRYIELFKKKKKEEKLSPAETSELDKLERKLSYEDLRFWRSLARNQLRKENVGVKKDPPKQTWTQWAWGGGKKVEETPKEGEDASMTEEQRKELYAAIDWDEKKAITESIDLPRESVKLQVESSLRTGSFTLKRDPHGQAIEILSMMFDNFQAKFLQRPDSLLADLSLGGLRINDGTTEGSFFPQIVNVKDMTSETANKSIENVSESAEDRKAKEKAAADSLFRLIFEQNPLDESADSAVTVKLKSIEVIYNPQFIVQIAKFFQPPERHMESIGALLETAGATVEGIRQQTRAGLEFALEEHKTLNANLDIQAPLIIIPESITSESTLCLVFDAGHVSLNSELVDKETMKDIQSKQKQKYSDEDFKQLEGLMYDKFLLKLDSTQVLIGPGIQATKDQLNAKDDSKNYHIVDRINMDFVLETSIIPKAADLTKTRISGHLPVLHASISDQKYKNMMKLIDIAIPKFESDGPSNDMAQAVPKKPSSGREISRADEALGRPRSKSLAGPAQQELVMEEDSEAENEQESRQATVKRLEDDGIKLHQRNFEFKFTVDKLQGSLFRADPEESRPDQLLVELVAEHFELDFYLRPYDMVAEVLLKSLSVDDYIDEDPSPEFKKIISSRGFGAKDDKDLFNVKFIKVNNDSPEFMSTYEGIATNLDVSISTLNLIVTRKTLLTLLDFVLITFASSDQAPQQARIGNAPESNDQVARTAAPADESTDKLRIKVSLESIALILNNDGVRLATLSLNTADVGVVLSGGAMKVSARLGNLSLLDDINQGAPEESPLRQLISIQGDELADFGYQTFDPKDRSYPGYDTEIYLRSGSLKVNFLEEPVRKIINFLVKFGKMQAIFNAARQAAANQASQMQENANKMHFDVLIKTPIIVFPRVMKSDRERDLLTAYLGEIYASNSFEDLNQSNDSTVVNRISAGIRHVRLTSDFHYEGGESEELEMIDKVDFDFKVSYVEHLPGLQRPDMQVEGNMSPINLCVAQTQLKLLLELSRTIPSAFATDPDQDENEIMEELPKATTESAKEVADQQSKGDDVVARPSHQGPELKPDSNSWTKLDFVFKTKTISLELILANEGAPVGNVADASLSKFALNDTSIRLHMKSDDSLESEILVNSFTIQDSRTKETNKFRKIMSLINNDVKQQFMANLTISGGRDRHMIAMLTIDSPRVILAIDYLFAVQSFVSTAFATDEAAAIPEDAEELSSTADGASDVSSTANRTVEEVPQRTQDDSTGGNPMSMSFRVDVVDAQVILIANPTIANSEAIVLGTKQVLLSQQNASTLQVTKIGMFLCRMDKFDSSRLRILDDFSIQMSMESRSKDTKSSMTSISIDIEPLVLRLSLRDILLALQIVNKASETMNSGTEKMEDTEPQKIKEITGEATGGAQKRKSTAAKPMSTKTGRASQSVVQGKPAQSDREKAPQSSIVMKREEMTATLEGIRVILIGDLHELPLIDWSIKRFNVDVRDWSGAMTGDTSFDTYINVYNFSKSSWEPLIEPWQLGFHMSKEQHPDRLAVELYSHKMMELTVTSATIALASKSADFLSTQEDVLSKPRGADTPYRIRNYTGFDVNVWATAEEDDRGDAARLSDGEEAPWRFEDPTTMRENLSPEGGVGVVGIKLEGSGFESIERIPVNREGETLYNLKPRKDKVLHRLLVEIKLGTDNVKYITFRSPLLVENNTQIPVDLGVFSPEEGHLLKIEKIPPGEGRPAPVGAAFMHSLVVRPDQGFGYAWSNERLFWKDLLKRPTRTVTCRGEENDQSPPFYFQLNTSYDKVNPLTSVYPYMRIKLHAPIELQNLLPYDFNYRIYDKNTKKNWTNFLRKGGISPVHVVELSHLLLLNIDMQDTLFKESEFAVINSNANGDFRRESVLAVKDKENIQLNLKLHYFNVPDSGGAFKVTVYTPYLVLNKTGLDINIQSKTMFSAAKSAAGQGVRTESDSGTQKALPYMFSYPSDDRKNRATLKVGDSSWSKPLSFDAIGSTFEAVLPSPTSKSELSVGVSVAEGEGKYKLTKVVTVAPRFVLKNKLREEINIREPGSSNVMSLKDGELLPLRYLKQTGPKQLCLCFPGVNNQWSSPFHISNVGTVHVKLAKAGQRQTLIRVEVIMEAATVFLHLSVETKHWPYSMRNESDMEFMFYQVNPNLGEDEDERGSAWKPIRYRLPARSIMPYAWDYPASKNKELVVTTNGKDRRIKLAEIGNLVPMKVPAAQGSKQQKIIDVNIAADGPTQTLVLSNYKPSKSMYKQKSGQNSQGSVATGFEVKELESDVTFKAQLRLAGIGISLVNKNLKELLYLTLREIEFKYSDSRLYQTLNATIKWVQIDNQLYGGIFPILLYPSVVPKTGKEMEAHPIFHSMVTRVKDDSYGVLYIKYATLLLQQMTLEIDEDFIFAMLDFAKVPGASWSEEKEGKLCDEDLDIPEPKQEQQGQDVYFELLHLQPMQLDLSFVRTERINAEDTTSSSNPLMFFVNVMTMSIGNVNDAPLRLNALMLENARVSIPALVANIQGHYTQEVVRQIHIVLGSADFLGNPVGLFNNVSSGVADIFYEPYQGLVMTDRPQELGIGIAKGASSFVKKSVFGFSDSMAKFTGSMSKGLAAATLDKEYQDQRRMSKSRNRPKHALYGVTSGGNAFASSMASGIGGLARHPLQGAEKEGLPGFVKGVGKGFLGLATKPAIGAFDLASNMAEGVRNTTTVFDAEGLDRVRLTRFIGLDGIVRPYAQREALGQFWLKTLDDGKYFHEDYIAHLELPGKDMMVMLTYSRIMLAKTKKLKTEWDIQLNEIQTISKERTGMSVTLKGGTNGPFIPVQDESSRNWLYKQIGIAVNAFNDKYNAKG
ncbi:MAG: hypothetical protein Q9211_002685 [Gyalolechia sp. 1 TL-2023]